MSNRLSDQPEIKEVRVAGFPGLSHVAVTVTDLERSKEFYGRLFGSEPVLDEDAGGFYHVVYALEGGALFGLHTHPTPNDQPDFKEFRTGLDHVAFGVSSRSELEKWESRLGELGINNGGIVDAPYGSGLSFRDPDNIALEFFAPPS
jgi:catechol 2,3-dioxygenase-like lactoylglutathione lyase family enzyme